MKYKLTWKEKGKKKGDRFSIFVKAQNMEKAIGKGFKELFPYERETYSLIKCETIEKEKKKKTIEERLFSAAVKEREQFLKMKMAGTYENQAIQEQKQRSWVLYEVIQKADLICEYHEYQIEHLKRL